MIKNQKLAPRCISVCLAICIAISITTLASNANANISTSLPFEEYVIRHLENFSAEIDITTYANNNNWNLKTCTSKFIEILNNNPQIFYVFTKIQTKEAYLGSKRIECKYMGIEYTIKKSEFPKKKQEFEAAVEKALKVVNDSMSNFEKALALHDYIVLNVRFDVAKPAKGSRSAYDALVKGVAVCQGYSMAYNHLLNLSGIESAYVTSDAMNHGWSYVKIGKNWYHVDSTYNDPLLFNKIDMHGRVSHKHFMLSDAAIRKMGHRSWSTNGLPAAKSTAYDNMFIRDVESGMLKLGDFWYYIKFDENSPAHNENFKKPNADKSLPYYTSLADIYRYNFKTNSLKKIQNINSTWFVWGTENSSSKSFWPGNYSSIAKYNGLLYFNDNKSIYSLDPDLGEIKKIFTVKANEGYIYGFTIDGDRISYSAKQSPDANNTIKRFKIA